MIDKKVDYYLFKYLEKILEFENELTSFFNLSDIPYNNQDKFPKSGLLKIGKKEIAYYFHGNGCSFNEGGAEIGYSIYPDRNNYIATAPFEFIQFVNTFKEIGNTPELSQNEGAQYLKELNSRGIVEKIFDDYLVYAINLDWYKMVFSDFVDT